MQNKTETTGKDSLTVSDYEEVLADHRRLVRELDVIINGDKAAKQASLCDLVGQVKELKAHTPAEEKGMKWRPIAEGSMPPTDQQVIFDNQEDCPIYGTLDYDENGPFIRTVDSDGEDDYEEISNYNRWLDESASPTPEAGKVDRLVVKCDQLRNLARKVYARGKEREEELTRAITDTAVAFEEWVANSFYYRSGSLNGKILFIHSSDLLKPVDEIKYLTTGQLYEVFLIQTRRQK